MNERIEGIIKEIEDAAFTRGVALALAEIHSGNSITMTLRSCGIHLVEDLTDASVDQFDIDRLTKYLD